MKILLVNYEFPPIGGGAGNTTKYLARELAAAGHEVKVLTSYYKGLKRKENISNFTIIRISALRTRPDRSNPLQMLAFCISACFWLIRNISDWRPHVCLAFFGIPSGIVGLFAKARYNIPYIVTL